MLGSLSMRPLGRLLIVEREEQLVISVRRSIGAALPKGLDMTPSDNVVLNNGISIPRLGLGVYQSGRGPRQ